MFYGFTLTEVKTMGDCCHFHRPARSVNQWSQVGGV